MSRVLRRSLLGSKVPVERTENAYLGLISMRESVLAARDGGIFIDQNRNEGLRF